MGVVYFQFHLGRHDFLEVTAKEGTMIFFIDEENFALFKNGEISDFYGCLVRTSPMHLQCPHPGQWYMWPGALGDESPETPKVAVISLDPSKN